MKRITHIAQRMVILCFFLPFQMYTSPAEHNKTFGACCSDVHAALESQGDCESLLQEFVHRIFQDRAKLSARDWQTVGVLVKQYIYKCLREKRIDKSKEILQQLLSFPLPNAVKNELRILWQSLNPENMPLQHFIEQFSSLNVGDSLQYRLLMDLYKMTLHSSYEERKQSVLLAKERGLYREAYDQAVALLQAIEKGECCPHEEVAAIETCFLKKTLLALQILLAENPEMYESLIPSYYLTEIAHTEAIDMLVERIAQGEVSRSDEVDSVLLSHAIRRFPVDPQKTIQELEVLIDGGKHLQSRVLYHGYFFLLEIYLQHKHFPAMERLLRFGEAIFDADHEAFPEYQYFLGAYLYALGKHSQAFNIFSGALSSAIRCGVTLAKIYEYLGCISCSQKNYSQAEEYFLRAYKGWDREEAGIGLFLTFMAQGKKEECAKMLQSSNFSFKTQRFLEALSSERGGALESCVSKISPCPSVSDIYSRCIYFMMKSLSFLSKGPVFELAQEVLNMMEVAFLTQVQQICPDLKECTALEFWKHKLAKTSSQRNLAAPGEPHVLTLCYRALYNEDQEAISLLPMLFSEESSALQSALRLVWVLTKNDDKKDSRYCYNLPLRPCGDRLYLLAYPLKEYFEGREEALQHLSLFPELFPHSSLLTLAYYLLGCGEPSLFLRAAWFVKALAEFPKISLFGEDAEAWVYMYYDIKCSLADAYFSLGDPIRAVEMLEEVKEDWYVHHHPYLQLLGKETYRNSIERRWVQGLAHGYAILNEKTRLAHHLLQHIEKTLLLTRSLQGALAITEALSSGPHL